tara:strand:- start:443 stop:1444 length:1002 start_codon:yes stop_codon:yes gene_type:complete
MSEFIRKAAEEAGARGSVYKNNVYSTVVDFVKNKLKPEYHAGVKAPNGEGNIKKNKAMKIMGDLSAFVQTLKNQLVTLGEMGREGLITKGINNRDEEILSKVISNDFDLDINVVGDLDDLKVNLKIPTENSGSAFAFKDGSAFKKTTSTTGVNTSFISLDQLSDTIVKNGKSNERNIIANELNVFKQKAKDGEDWNPMLADNVLANNIEKFNKDNFRALINDPMVGTRVFRDDFIEGNPELNNIQLPYIHPADTNADGTLDEIELTALSLEEKATIFDEYVNMAEEDPIVLEDLQKKWAGWLTSFFEQVVSSNFIKKPNTQESDFDPNSYKKI